MTAKEQRLAQANELLTTIASCGRKFFSHESRISHLELRRGRVWFIDKYTEKAIYTHYELGRWRGFTEGGTLRSLVIALRKWITSGQFPEYNHLGPWPDWYCGSDPWGYKQDMALVRAKAQEIGFAPLPKREAT